MSPFYKTVPIARWRLAPEWLILSGLFFVTFWPTLSWMWGRFTFPGSFYSHGPLIPLVAGFILWARRDRFRASPERPRAAGLALLIPALALHCISTATDIHVISGFAMVAALCGVSLYLMGGPFTLASSPALVLILFMVPLPQVFMIDTAFLMQVMSAHATARLLNLIGVAIIREGVVLAVPGRFTLQIDYACSGLRSLLVFVTAAWVIIALSPRIRALPSILMLALSFPLALLSNVVRLATTVLSGIAFGYSGVMHMAAGIVSFAVYAGLMFFIGRKVLWRKDSSFSSA